MSEQSAEAYGFKIDEEISRIFRDWRKLTTKVYSMLTLQKCVQLVNQVLSQVYQMLTVVDVSSVTTVVAFIRVDRLIAEKQKRLR